MMIRWMIYLGLLIFAAYESVVFEDATATDVESLHENPCSGGREE